MSLLTKIPSTDKTAREAKELVKDMTPKEKWNHFWYYYKTHVLIGIFVFAVLFVFIKDFVTQKEVVLNVVALNAATTSETQPDIDAFLSYAGHNPDKQTIYLDTALYLNPKELDSASLTATQKMSALAMSGDLDILISDSSVIDYYAMGNYLSDITAQLPADLLASLQDDIHYYNNIPVAVNISDSAKLKEWGIYYGEDVYFSILANTSHLDTIIAFLNYLYE